MGFEFNFSGPIEFIQRYLRILGYDKNSQIQIICEQLARFQLNYSTFLKYKPSQLAACIVLIAINILKKTEIDSLKKKHGSEERLGSSSPLKNKMKFFETCKQTGLLIMNTDIWNNEEVAKTTGYSIEMIKEPLLTLSQHLQSEIKSSQLEDFNIDSILSLRNYQDRID